MTAGEVTQADRDAAERWGTGPVYNMQHLAEAFARHRQSALSDAVEAMRELGDALEGMIPKNVCLTNSRWPDDTVIPIDATLGDFRSLSATLAKLTDFLAQGGAS
jgi:hypothetical protein